MDNKDRIFESIFRDVYDSGLAAMYDPDIFTIETYKKLYNNDCQGNEEKFKDFLKKEHEKIFTIEDVQNIISMLPVSLEYSRSSILESIHVISDNRIAMLSHFKNDSFYVLSDTPLDLDNDFPGLNVGDLKDSQGNFQYRVYPYQFWRPDILKLLKKNGANMREIYSLRDLIEFRRRQELSWERESTELNQIKKLPKYPAPEIYGELVDEKYRDSSDFTHALTKKEEEVFKGGGRPPLRFNISFLANLVKYLRDKYDSNINRNKVWYKNDKITFLLRRELVDDLSDSLHDNLPEFPSSGEKSVRTLMRAINKEDITVIADNINSYNEHELEKKIREIVDKLATPVLKLIKIHYEAMIEKMYYLQQGKIQEKILYDLYVSFISDYFSNNDGTCYFDSNIHLDLKASRAKKSLGVSNIFNAQKEKEISKLVIFCQEMRGDFYKEKQIEREIYKSLNKYKTSLINKYITLEANEKYLMELSFLVKINSSI